LEEAAWNISGTNGRIILKLILIEIFRERMDDTELIKVGLSGGLFFPNGSAVSQTIIPLCFELICFTQI
jgi:hypothetical protein